MIQVPMTLLVGPGRHTNLHQSSATKKNACKHPSWLSLWDWASCVVKREGVVFLSFASIVFPKCTVNLKRSPVPRCVPPRGACITTPHCRMAVSFPSRGVYATRQDWRETSAHGGEGDIRSRGISSYLRDYQNTWLNE